VKKKTIWLVITCLITASLLLVSCAPTTTEEEEKVSPKPEAKDEYAIIKGIDSSQMKLYGWSFLYRWADYSQPPPKGFTYSAGTRRGSDLLFLKKSSDVTKTPISSSEIARIEMSWEEDEYADWLKRKSLTIVKTNGERIVLSGSVYEYIDMSKLTSKEYALEHGVYLYIIGNTRDQEGYAETVEYPLFYQSSILYEQDNLPVPEEIIFSSE